jgi:hypothetical protein
MARLLKDSTVKLTFEPYFGYEASILESKARGVYLARVKDDRMIGGYRDMELSSGEFTIINGIYQEDNVDYSYAIPEPLVPVRYGITPYEAMRERLYIYAGRVWPANMTPKARAKAQQVARKEREELDAAFIRDLKIAYNMTGDLEDYADRILSEAMETDETWAARSSYILDVFNDEMFKLRGYKLVKDETYHD